MTGIGLQRVGGQRNCISRGNIAFAAKFGPLIEVQLLDDLQGQQITFQDFNFCIKIGGIVVVGSARGIFKADEGGIHFVDGDAACRVVNRNHAQGGNQDHQEDDDDTGNHYKLSLDEDAQIFAKYGVL